MRDPYIKDPDLEIYQGDSLEVMREMADRSVDMICTSPPFFGLRDYQHEDQIGLEEHPDQWVASLAAIFDEARRVISDQGTLWIEVGDSYVSAGGAGNQGENGQRASRAFTADGKLKKRSMPGLKPKDLIGAPWMLAFAVRSLGWYLRSEIIWHKPNALPESVQDRPTKGHSTVFLFSKSSSYFYNLDAIRVPFAAKTRNGNVEKRSNPAAAVGASDTGYAIPWKGPSDVPQEETLDGLPGESPRGPDGRRATNIKGGDFSIQYRDGDRWPNPAGANARTVWEIPTEPTHFEHFACFPQELVRRMILAGCPEGGTVLDCFGGSGTTALVARSLGRRSVLIELNPEYVELAAGRLAQQSLLA